jgi:hypothetical protein
MGFAEEIEQEIKKEFNGEWRCGSHKKGISGILFGLFVLILGVIWLGNELTWWEITFPLIPAIIILIGLSILYNELKKRVNK